MNSQMELLRKLTALNTAVNNKLGRGNERHAPHKPLLLLRPLELGEQSLLDNELLMPRLGSVLSSRPGPYVLDSTPMLTLG